MIQCPKCNASNQANALFCEMCGERLNPAPSMAVPPVAVPTTNSGGPVCSTCGHQALPGEVFCEECGTPLANAASAPVVQQSSSAAPVVNAPIGAAATCPSCGTGVLPGEAFCENCGASLLNMGASVAPAFQSSSPEPVAPPVFQPATPSAPSPAMNVSPPPVQPSVVTPPASTGAGDLSRWRLSTVTGAEIALPAKTEVLIGREDAASSHYPDIDLTPYGALQDGVGRKHARLFLNNGQVVLEDLNSTNGTLINRQKLQPGQIQPLNPGDEIRLGKLVLTLRQ